MRNKAIKPGATVTKVLVWNNVENDAGYDVSECELTFSDGSTLFYELDSSIDELEDKHTGIYELLPTGEWIQIEDWE